jgi:hypothetical protein
MKKRFQTWILICYQKTKKNIFSGENFVGLQPVNPPKELVPPTEHCKEKNRCEISILKRYATKVQQVCLKICWLSTIVYESIGKAWLPSFRQTSPILGRLLQA